MDLHVINTNKLTKGVKPTTPPGPAPQFYTSTKKRWWKEQKVSLQNKLKQANAQNTDKNALEVKEGRSFNRWQVVVGHHPAEYVYLSIKEHGLWGIRYFPTTFMRGNPKNIHKRNGLAHILRREADLYLCGHQHLSAYMKLSRHGKYRPKGEQRCLFAIVGNSSKLDQDEGDFDDDFVGGRAYQIEEKLAKRLFEKSDSCSEDVLSSSLKPVDNIVVGDDNDEVFSNDKIHVPKRRQRTLSIPQNVRYEKEWSQPHTFGFAVACVTRNYFKLTFIEVYKDGGYRESKTVEL
jgi:hypothetical protein